jgi:hydrogenase nickel incorporation protein HypA/HybF
MHELSITQGILNIALEKATEAQASRITAINLVIGDMANIIDECVQFYFNFLSKDTIANYARLIFKHIPMEVRCRNCNHSFRPKNTVWSCPQCKKWDAEIIAGHELLIDSIEVE